MVPKLWLCIGASAAVLLYLLHLATRRRTSLRDKVVLITGASSGLGEACAHAFFKAGCKVILCARRKGELERVKKELLELPVMKTAPHPPTVLELDLAELETLPSKAQDALKIHGKIDILINNGGISFRGNVLDTSLDVDIKVMTVNYFGQVALTKALLPSMVSAGGGHIVAVSSVQGRITVPYRSAYAASKHAMQAFFDCLRYELAHQGIRVSVVSPGYIQTNLSLNAVTSDGSAHGVMDKTTASGFPPADVATRIFRVVTEERNEDIPAPLVPRLAIYIRALLPALYFSIMKFRVKKQQAEMMKEK